MPSTDRNLAGDGQRRAFTPALILFIALPDPQDKSAFDLHAFPLALLPRRCPRCGFDTIIGHGQRRKQAHDEHHDWIWVRRGLCRPCGETFTILPAWSAPYGHYSLDCRREAWESSCHRGGAWNKLLRSAKIPIDYQIQPRCGVGPVADC